MGERASAEEWKDLFLAAEQFRLLAPWEWMDDTQVFGVRDPWTGEIGWCVVMGAGGTTYGLAVYRGERGYGCYTLTKTGRVDGADLLAYMDGLLLDLCDREELTAADRERVKAAGLKPRGRGAWPQFRSYLPWHAPWYLTSDEARYMRLVLGQASYVAGRARSGAAPPLSERSRLLVREPRPAEGGWVWADVWVEPTLPKQPSEIWPAPGSVEGLLSGCARTDQTWEVDVFPAGATVSDGRERPVTPPMLLVASDGFPPAVQAEAVSPGPDMWEKLLAAWLKGALQAEMLPGRLRVKREAVAAMMGPTARLLGIPLEKKTKLRSLDGLRRSLERSLAGWRS